MIPVLICPVISRFDLLEQMIASLDHPIGQLVIVDNSLSGYEFTGDAPTVERIQYIRPLIGLGYPGGINIGISQTPGAPWWAWTNNDIRFGPGDLRHIDAVMTEATDARMITGSDRGLRNAYGAMNIATVDRVGLFDDWSFFPIYFDDDDYERRCHLGDVEWVTYNGAIAHGGSQTIKSDAGMSDANARTFMDNRARYVAKWGDITGAETFSTPWNTGYPLSYSPPDIAGRHRRAW